MQINVKPEVRFKRFMPCTIAFLEGLALASAHTGYTLTITSANDGKHRDGSFHYDDKAWDLRTWCFTATQRESIKGLLEASLGKSFRVIFEPDKNPDPNINTEHLHVEYVGE
jgi:hypothetical protein